MVGLVELLIPLAGAGIAAFSSAAKSWLARKSLKEIVIDLGNGSKIVLDGSAESRERIRTSLAKALESPSGEQNVGASAAREAIDSALDGNQPSKQKD
jgi:hypothetical protein